MYVTPYRCVVRNLQTQYFTPSMPLPEVALYQTCRHRATGTHMQYLFLAASLCFLVLKLLMIRVARFKSRSAERVCCVCVQQLFSASNTSTESTKTHADTERKWRHAAWHIHTGELIAVVQLCGCWCNITVQDHTQEIYTCGHTQRGYRRELVAATVHMHRCGEV